MLSKSAPPGTMRACYFLAVATTAALSLPSFQLPWMPHKAVEVRDKHLKPTVPDLNHWRSKARADNRKLCVIEADPDGGDDAPAIMKTLNEDCRENSLVVLPDATYNIHTNMTTTSLEDVIIHQYGRLLWTKDIEYWLSVSMYVNFQNQSTVWYFGGDNVIWDGHGFGTFDGNGQVWYDWAKGRGNLPKRPMNINYVGFNNSIVRNMRYVQSQMWTMAITYSHNLLFDNIYVNSTSNSQYNTLNTDGVDTIYSDNITFSKWTVSNGDDAVALKRNSTNIFLYDSVFYNGQGVAIGSLAQYDGEIDIVENFYARNITLINTAYVSYLKTWSGTVRGYPPNGGGGGLGYARNIVMEDIQYLQGRSSRGPFFSWQCEHYEGGSGKDCNSSTFALRDVVWKNVKGTAKPSVLHAGTFQCSEAAGGCYNLTIEDFDVRRLDTGEKLDKWRCENVVNQTGFTCNA